MTSPAPTDRDQSLEFCKKYINNPKDELYLPELIATLPIYEKIAYDTVLEKPVIRSSKSKTWHELKDDTIAPIRDALKKRLKAYGRDLRNEEEFDEAEKVDDAILRIERFDKILLSALPSIVKPGETKKRTSCIKFLQGWMLCEDDILVRIDIGENRLLCAETDTLSMKDHFLEDMRVRVRSSDIVNAIEMGNRGEELRGRLFEVFRDAWYDHSAFRYQHSILAYAFWMKRRNTLEKQVLLTIGPSDVAKDSQLLNPLRHMAPGLCKVMENEWFTGRDQTKLAQQVAYCGYPHFVALPDANLVTMDLEKIRTVYGNHSEKTMRMSGVATTKTVSTFPALMLMANYEKVPSRGFADTDAQKFCVVLANEFDEEGQSGDALMRRFIGDNGEKIKPSAEARPYVAKPYSSTAGVGQSWPYTNDFGQFQLNQLALSVRDFQQGHPDDTWDPKRGRPVKLQHQHRFLEGSRKRKRDEALAALPELPPVQVVIGYESLPANTTPDDFFRRLMDKVLQRFVRNVPGRHVKPQVLSPTLPPAHPATRHRPPNTMGRWPLNLPPAPLSQTIAEALREMTNELEWKIIDGPPDLNKDAKFKEKVRDLFAEMAGVEWIKKSGGAKYQGEKICGHHLPNCTLRPLATPPLPVEEESD